MRMKSASLHEPVGPVGGRSSLPLEQGDFLGSVHFVSMFIQSGLAFVHVSRCSLLVSRSRFLEVAVLQQFHLKRTPKRYIKPGNFSSFSPVLLAKLTTPMTFRTLLVALMASIAIQASAAPAEACPTDPCAHIRCISTHEPVVVIPREPGLCSTCKCILIPIDPRK